MVTINYDFNISLNSSFDGMIINFTEPHFHRNAFELSITLFETLEEFDKEDVW